MVERAKMYGCEKLGFILDRGYFSVDNIKYFERSDFDYILMTKGNALFIKDAIHECMAPLKGGYKCFLSEYELFSKTIEKNLFDTEKINISMFTIMA